MAGNADEDSTRMSISLALEVEGQYLETVPVWDQNRVGALRRLGHEVAHELGHQARTFTVSADDELLVHVWVVAKDPGGEAELSDGGAMMVRSLLSRDHASPFWS